MTATTTAPSPTARSVGSAVRPLVAVFAGAAAVGVPLALCWVLLAPEAVARVGAEGAVELLTGENEHRFDDLAIMVLLALAAGLVLALVLWTFRDLRGPLTLLTAMSGSVLAGVIGVGAGEWLAERRYDDSGAVGELVEIAPEIDTWWVLLAMPLAFALTYATLTACTTAPDLGRRDQGGS